MIRDVVTSGTSSVVVNKCVGGTVVRGLVNELGWTGEGKHSWIDVGMADPPLPTSA